MLIYKDSWSFNITFGLLNFKKSERLDITFCFNIKIRPLQHNFWKALNVSKCKDQTSWPLSKDLCIWWVMDWNWFVNQSPDLKSDWLWDIKLFSAKNLNILPNYVIRIFGLKLEVKKQGKSFLIVCCFFEDMDRIASFPFRG